jgi:hypothetical protein
VVAHVQLPIYFGMDLEILLLSVFTVYSTQRTGLLLYQVWTL